MKRLFDVLVEKLREVEANWVSLGLGVFGIITLLTCASIVNNIIKMIVRIVELLAGNVPVG